MGDDSSVSGLCGGVRTVAGALHMQSLLSDSLPVSAFKDGHISSSALEISIGDGEGESLLSVRILFMRRLDFGLVVYGSSPDSRYSGASVQ